ncbi:MAG: hypothetical protein J7L51_00965 [Desulfurococcales archaeon]|nr:hypothetical protein [Desulfurococcales archaeon]
MRVIEIVPGQVITRESRAWLPVKEGYVQADVDRGILHIAVVDRHRGTKNVGKAFIRGLGLKRGAIASTVAHDHHNTVVGGTSPNDMLTAIKHLKKIHGGFAAVSSGKVIADLPLELAGLMATKPAEHVVSKLTKLNKTVQTKLGATLKAPFMQLQFITLPTVPELGITDKGLVDSMKYEIIDPIIEVKVDEIIKFPT